MRIQTEGLELLWGVWSSLCRHRGATGDTRTARCILEEGLEWRRVCHGTKAEAFNPACPGASPEEGAQSSGERSGLSLPRTQFCRLWSLINALQQVFTVDLACETLQNAEHIHTHFLFGSLHTHTQKLRQRQGKTRVWNEWSINDNHKDIISQIQNVGPSPGQLTWLVYLFSQWHEGRSGGRTILV